MGDEQKIWFVYLTDHHEGPFTASEVAAKAQEGLVTAQSLGWKDGMAEWVPIESIPELNAALAGGGAATPAPASMDAPLVTDVGGGEAGGDGFSLAQMLASQQGGAGAAPASDAGMQSLSPKPAAQTASIMMNNPMASAPVTDVAASYPEPGADEEVWTLRVGSSVSGLYSLQKLKQLAGEGDVPADALLWHPGWSDFQPVSGIKEVNSARKAKKIVAGGAGAVGGRAGAGVAQQTKTGIKRPGGITPAVAGADAGADDPTDPSIVAKPSFLDKIKSLFAKKKNKAAPAPAAAAKTAKKAVVSAKSSSGKIKKLAAIAGVVLVLGGGGAAYFLFFSSPIPSNLDVSPSELETMVEVAKRGATNAGFHASLAKGSLEDPADESKPKIYIATGLPEGTPVEVTLRGVPGTLVNKVNFEKKLSLAVNKSHLVVVEGLSDEGDKPIPMGEYKLEVAAAGAETLNQDIFLGGKKGAVYDRRLKQYKEKMQEEFDKQMKEVRELVSTVRTVVDEVNKRIGEFKASPGTPAEKLRLDGEWKSYQGGFTNMVTQLDQKAKEAANAPDKGNKQAYTDVSALLAQITQLAQAHTEQLAGRPAANFADLSAGVDKGMAALEQWMAQAVLQSPFEVAKGGAAPAPAATAPTPAPASATPPTAAPAAPAAGAPPANP